MPILSAKFKIYISSPCYLEWPDDGPPPEVSVATDGFDVVARILPSGQGHKRGAQRDFVRPIDFLEITVSRDEQAAPPPLVIRPDGTRDSADQHTYLRERLDAYRGAAVSVANRVLSFFKFRLHTPLVRVLSPWEHAFNNPTWYDQASVKLPAGTMTVVFAPMPGSDGELGVERLTPDRMALIRQYVESPGQPPSLVEELLSDAQSAWFDNNLRRAILELAICTEILVKRKFFAESSPAGAAFDYLEDKAKISVRVIDLLDAVAKEAFTRSYKDEAPDGYKNIDRLFRCRNKIAHRGELSFRDDGGTTVVVGRAAVEKWYETVTHLRNWLDNLR